MKKVLIIDDEIDICMMLKAYLQKNNFEVNYACSLKDGLQNLGKTSPDYLILDNNLPDGLGVSSIKKIKSQSPNTFIIMLSAMTSVKNTAIENGVDYFLKKPFRLNEINQILNFGQK
ncbi:response regulator transcription factor [Lacihabitans lacunae]|jgi:DNA-binding response OmpR family regulator|uniref:Response regulator transcription factor n=1 Tax=Lacihabitans lacunae TaxID=1028214 RepID=A0ABV7YTE7_9BACT